MAYTNTTQYYNLPQFLDTDKPSWDDINTAFQIIDTTMHNIAISASGITAQEAQTMIDNSLVDAIFYDAVNGTGLTSGEYSKLKIN